MVLLQMTPLTRPAIRQQRTRRGWIGTWLISLVIELFHYRLPKGDEIDRNQGHEYSALIRRNGSLPRPPRAPDRDAMVIVLAARDHLQGVATAVQRTMLLVTMPQFSFLDAAASHDA